MSQSVSPTRRVLRYRFAERLMHGVAAVSYLYLLATGLALWTPALYWLAVVLGGGYLSRVVHPWTGLLFAAAVGYMFVEWRRDMRTTTVDRIWRRAMVQYIRNEDHLVPPADRFNFGQKNLFWLMVVGTAALLISGVGLWLTASIPWHLQWMRQASAVVHAVAALATIGGFIIHVYMGTAVVPAGLKAIVHGEVTEEWARHHHPLWLERVNAGSSDTSTSRDASV